MDFLKVLQKDVFENKVRVLSEKTHTITGNFGRELHLAVWQFAK